MHATRALRLCGCARRAGSRGSSSAAPLVIAIAALGGGALSEDEKSAFALWPFARNSPFDYPALRKGVERRQNATATLQRYMTQAKPKVEGVMRKRANKELSDEDFNKAMVELRETVTNEAQKILYGLDDKGARQRYELEFGCCKWTDSALAAVAKLSPLIEIGAGRGHWQRALEAAGADVIAYDSGETPAPLRHLPPVGKVRRGDEQQLASEAARGRALLLVCPPPGPMALRCVKAFQGDKMALVSEGRGGVHADAAFFDYLEADWKVEHWEELDTFPQCFERLFILRRIKPLAATKQPPSPPMPPQKSSG